MTAPDLKPCPFCGGGAVVSADMARFPQVACDACGATCGQAREEGVAAAKDDWNRRDPAALAGDETVQALVGAVVEEVSARVFSYMTSTDSIIQQQRIHAAIEFFETDVDKPAELVRDTIRALRPDATAALSRALQQARNDALEEAERGIVARWGEAPAGSNESAGLYDAVQIIRALRKAQP
jgi:Lar family restriction alleviation protein